MAADLLLHCGGNKAPREKVEKVTTPEGTASWFPVPHKTVIESVVDKLPEFGLTVLQEQYALMRDEHRMFGLIEVTHDDDDRSESALTLGLRNSHDKSFPVGVCIGQTVFVCDNLAFHSEVIIKRKHTVNVMRDLPGLINRALAKLVTSRVDQERRVEAYKNCELSDKDAHDLIFNLYHNKAINPTRVAKVGDEWKTPSHNEFAPRNMWSFHNAITETMKGLNPFELQTRSAKLHPVLDAFCGFLIEKPQEPQTEITDAEFTVNGEVVQY